MPVTKNRDAYRRYTTFVSDKSGRRQQESFFFGNESGPLYSMTLHMRVRRARTSWVTSLTILAFCLGGIVTNHFARRTLPDVKSGFSQSQDGDWIDIPWRETRRM
jgi:hypothetical protein